MSYLAETFTSLVLIIFVWFICMILIKKLFNNYNRNSRISPNYNRNIGTSNINTTDNDCVIIINPQNIVTLGKISD